MKTDTSKIYTTVIDTDPVTNELVMVFPPELLAVEGWKEGDRLRFTTENNTCIISNLCAIEREKTKSE
jgi:hypothetical protein